mmetsp:Transcript_47836/g.112922  ORF Transcript_47836/g.112922 Transcript_47836/m.112922 type:complete len:207 (-) Transcript_47836:238-858(-)
MLSESTLHSLLVSRMSSSISATSFAADPTKTRSHPSPAERDATERIELATKLVDDPWGAIEASSTFITALMLVLDRTSHTRRIPSLPPPTSRFWPMFGATRSKIGPFAQHGMFLHSFRSFHTYTLPSCVPVNTSKCRSRSDASCRIVTQSIVCNLPRFPTMPLFPSSVPSPRHGQPVCGALPMHAHARQYLMWLTPTETKNALSSP